MRRLRGRSAAAVGKAGDRVDSRVGVGITILMPFNLLHEPQSARNRAHMAAATMPALVCAELLFAAAIWLVCRPALSSMAWWELTAPLAAMVAAGAVTIALIHSDSRVDRDYRHMQIAVMANALVQGLCWSVWFLRFGRAPLPGSDVVIFVHAALLLLGTIAFAPVPLAALLLWGIGGASWIWNTGSWEIAALTMPVLMLAVIMLGTVSERSHAASRRWRAAAEQSLKAAALLRDFEEQGRGWFWETDARGKLSYISPRLAADVGRSMEDMIGLSMTALVQSDQDDDGSWTRAERSLGFYLSTQLAFADVAVRGLGTPQPCWWSLSGRPAFDEAGQFLGFRGSGTDLTEMRRSEEEVKRLASYDALTGLPNRILMRRTLDESLRDVAGRPKQAGLFMLDLDRFKTVNDTLGHPVGDMLLRQVAERIGRAVQDDGQVGRLGGDEFNVVLPGIVDSQRLGKLADLIIQQLSRPYLIEGAHVSIGASIGIAVAPQDGACPDALIRNADLALYAAKAAGKGVHRFYGPEMHASAKDRRLLEMDLRNVMADGGLHLVYQPVVDAAQETIVGFEALARWNHPTRGMVSPAEFIPIAEEIGLIAQIGEWVLRTACLEATNWPESVRIAVNISPIQFANPGLPGLVMSALAAAQLAPDRLELEITEGVFLAEDAATDAMFARLKALGVRFALDDFGTGYSSLGYLKNAPFNKIKVDQSFVRGAAVPGNRNAAIIRAIVTLAESLGMETTAEGAETPDEVALIRSLGCSHIQGYIFGKPMVADEARARVSATGRLGSPMGLTSREPRSAVLRSIVIRGGKGSVPARVRNMSRTGAMIECADPPARDSRITIEFTDGEQISGSVAWAESDRFGMAFDSVKRIEQRLNRGGGRG